MRLGIGARGGHLLGRLILLRGGKDQRGVAGALGWRRNRLAVGQRVGSLIDVAGVEGERALAVHRTDAAADAAGMAAIEDDGEMNALVESGVEDVRHLAVADVVAALVGVGGNERSVGVNILAIDEHRELVALAVDAQGAVAGVVKDYRVALLRHVDEVFLHGGEDAAARGLIGRKDDNAGTGMRRSGIGEQGNVGGREAELGTGKQVGHGLGVVDGAVEILEGAQFAAAVDAAGGMIGRGAGRLIRVDADEQRPLSLRNG